MISKLKFRLKKIIFFLIYSKKDFFPPKKNLILLYDENSIFLKRIIKRSTIILSTRGEQLNLFICFYILINNFSLIFNLRKFKFQYIILYIKFVDPKIVITYIDNDAEFYKLKNFFKKKIFISIQNGFRFYKEDLFSELKKKKLKNLSCDYIFCFNKKIATYYKRYINCKTIVLGSVKNNSVKVNKTKKKNCLLISSYGVSKLKVEKKIIKILSTFCEKNLMTLNILARREKKSEEIFYKNLNYKIKFIKKNKDYKKSYHLTDEAKIVVSLNNTLGYESLSRGNKTLFLNFNDRKISCDSYKKYSWPKKFKDNGPFWTSKKNDISIKNLLTKLNKMNQKKWKIILKKYKPFKIYNNSILTNIINHYL